jgi:glycosyltransferase involved in cell wall biosynthesis
VTHNLDREGAQTTLLDLLAGLKESGLADPFIISPCDGSLSKESREAGIPVSIVPAPGRRANGAQMAEYRARLGSVFAATSTEVVLANTLESHVAISAASEAEIGSVWWQHEGGSWRHYFRHLHYSVRARAYAAFAQCYRVVQVADATRLNWLPLATRDNFELIRPGIPADRLEADLARWDRAEARDQLGLAPTDCCVLLLGSVSARKGQADVVRALASLPRDEGLNLRIFIAGALVDQSYRNYIEAALDGLENDRRAQVKLLGTIPDPSLYYSAADIFVCCSRQESAPRSIVEAMAFGLPVVSTPVDGIPELVQFGFSGLSFPVGDFCRLGKLLLQLSASPDDRRRLGAAGRELVPQLSDYQSMVARFGALLREAARLGDNPGVIDGMYRRSA